MNNPLKGSATLAAEPQMLSFELQFELQIIDAPAACLRCGANYASPTTGKLLNRCHCGGELKTK